MLRFRDLGVFVFEFWVLRASVFVFECFVFETTLKSLLKMLFRRKEAAEKFFNNKLCTKIVFLSCKYF